MTSDYKRFTITMTSKKKTTTTNKDSAVWSFDQTNEEDSNVNTMSASPNYSVPNISIVKLTSTNWSIWKSQLTDLMESLGIDEAIMKDISTIDKRKNGTAKLYINTSIEDPHLRSFINEKKSAFDMFETLKNHFEKQDLLAAQRIRRRINEYRFDDPNQVEEVMKKLETDIELLRQKTTVTNDEIFAFFASATETNNFKSVMANVQALSDNDIVVSIDTLKNQIKHYGISMKNYNSSSEIRIINKQYNRTQIKCYECDDYGHIRRYCPKLQQNIENRKNYIEQNDQNNLKDNPRFKRRILTKKIESLSWINNQNKINNQKRLNINCISSERQPNKARFILDNCAVDHFVNDINLLTDIRTIPTISVSGVCKKEDATFFTNKIGNITIQVDDGSCFSFQAYLIPELEDNYFSLFVFGKDKDEYIMINNGILTVQYDNTHICTAYHEENKNYSTLFNIKYMPEEIEEIEENKKGSIYNIWHRKLGHYSNDRINKTANILKEIKPIKKQQKCETCIKCKFPIPDFKTNTNQATKVLERVHSDLSGKLKESFDGFSYYMTLIDEYSRYCQVYFLKSKSETTDAIKKYIVWAERQTGEVLKCLKSDNGGEYINENLAEYFISKGIDHSFSSPYCPQTNGLAERKNRTLKESARSMMYEANLPNSFWSYAIRYANFTCNRIVNTRTEQIPYFSFTNRLPCFHKAHIFGCKVMIEKNNFGRIANFENRRNDGIFLGITEDHTKYIAFDIIENRITVNRNMYCIDDILPYKHQKTNKNYFSEDNDGSTSKINESNDTINVKMNNEEIEIVPINNNVEKEIDNNENDIDNNEVINNESIINEPRYPIRSTRNIKPIRYQSDHSIQSMNMNKSINVKEALNGNESELWRNAINEEIDSLKSHDVFERININDTKDKRILGSKLVLVKKKNDKNMIIRYKARLVVKGYEQIPDVDFSETYAPVGRNTTFRVLLTFASINNFYIGQYDVKTAYLHSDIDIGNIYIKPPIEVEKPEYIWHLKKSLYGLKQSGRNWFIHLKNVLNNCDIKQSESDFGLFHQRKYNTFILIYVDDILIISPTEIIAREMFLKLKNYIDIKDLGPISNFLGWQIKKKNNLYELNQNHYIETICQKFGLENCKPISYPIGEFKIKTEHQELDQNLPVREIIGCLQYISYKSRPDITATVQFLSRYMHKPTQALFNACKNVIKYLKTTKHYNLYYGKIKENNIIELYTDASFDNPSVSGILIHWYGSPIIWTSKRQNWSPTSTAESETYAICTGLKEMMWLSKLMNELDFKTEMMAYCDNQAAIKIVKDGPNNSTKHIEITWAAINHIITNINIKIKYKDKNEMLADILTKPLSKSSIGRKGVLKVIGMAPMEDEQLISDR